MIGFNSHGKIIGIEKESSIKQEWKRKSGVIHTLLKKNWITAQDGLDRLKFIRLRKGEFLIPGFIDTHTHAVQYTNVGVGQQYELLDWLKNVTFVEEERYSSDPYAQRIFEKVVKRLLNSGTTTCSYFSSIHLSAAKVLSNVCFEMGQRAFIGKCNMDRNETFESYKEDSAEESLKDTIELIDYVRQHCVPGEAHCTSTPLKDPPVTKPESVHRSPCITPGQSTALVQPILTPRFAISCTDELLRRLGELLQSDPGLRLQTHLCESKSEISFTKSLFPNIDTYTGIYDEFRLLTPRTILAHCIHLDPREIELIKQRECGLSHCPSSNFNLRSGICQVKSLLDEGIEKIGLGTDVSGGHGLGMLSCIRDGMIATKALAFEHHGLKETPDVEKGLLSIKNLFYLATLGGARVCDLEEQVGNFRVGKEFDGMIVQTGLVPGVSSCDDIGFENLKDEDWIRFGLEDYQDGLNPNFFIDEFQCEIKLEDLFEKFLFTGDDRNIASVFVKGKIVGGARKTLLED